MRIVHAISGLCENIEGLTTERILSRLSGKYDFELIAPTGNYLFDRLSATRVKLTPMPLSGGDTPLLGDIIRLGRYFRHTSPSIIHTHGFASAGVAGLLSGVRRLISTAPNENGRNYPVSRAYRAKALTISHTASMTRELIYRGIPRDRIVNLPYGVENEINGISRDSVGSIILSEVIAEEDCPMLLSAVARARSRSPFDLVLVAEREHWQCIFRFSALFGIRPYIRVVEPGYALEYYRSCRYFIYPSTSYSEFPTQILRAMSFGCAVVVPSLPICRDIVRDGVCGLLYNASDSFALAECISRLNSDAELTDRLGKAAKERWQKHYSLDCMLSEYDRLYTSVLMSDL